MGDAAVETPGVQVRTVWVLPVEALNDVAAAGGAIGVMLTTLE